MIGSSLSSFDESLGLAKLSADILKSADKKISSTKIKQYFTSHPFPASLQSLSQLFTTFEVDHLRLTIDPANIYEMQFPLITSIDTPNISERFVLLEKMDTNKASLKIEGKVSEMPTEEFLAQWQGREILLFSADEAKIPKAYAPAFTDQLGGKFFLGIGLIIFFSILFLKITDTNYFLGIFLSSLLALGGLITVLIIAEKEAGRSHPWLNRFCKNDQIDTCDLLLHSSYAHIVPGISWTSIGFVFFSALLSFLLLSPKLDQETLNLLLLLSLSSLPGVAISLFIQGFLSDFWCRLCVLVQGILLTLFLSLSWAHGWPSIPNFETLAFAVLSIFIGMLLWRFFNLQLDKELKAQAEHKDLQALKFNDQIIQALFHKPSFSPYETKGLQIGNPNSPISLLFISNPACPKCSEAHEELLALWQQYEDMISIEFLFHLYEGNDNQIALIQDFQHLHTQDESLFLTGLKHWYADITQPINTWEKRYEAQLPPKKEDNEAPIIKNNTLSKLPTIYVNGNKVPDAYFIADLAYIFPQLQAIES